MFIGHLAAGYIATYAWLEWRSPGQQRQRVLMAAGLVGSVLPDIDMLRFYLIDQQRYHHHSYVTHMPLFWMALLGGIMLAGWRLRSSLVLLLGMVAGANILLHCVLDSLVGSIQSASGALEAGLCDGNGAATAELWLSRSAAAPHRRAV